MGMDHAVHLEDRAFAGADTLATARALALWLARGNFDLIMLGKYSLDAETGQVGPEIAELIGVAQITGVRKLEIDGRTDPRRARERRRLRRGRGRDARGLTCAERVAQPVKVKPGASERRRPNRSRWCARPSSTPTRTNFGARVRRPGCRRFASSRRRRLECKIIDATDPERAAREVMSALESIGALKPRVHRSPPDRGATRKRRAAATCGSSCETDLEGRSHARHARAAFARRRTCVADSAARWSRWVSAAARASRGVARELSAPTT